MMQRKMKKRYVWCLSLMILCLSVIGLSVAQGVSAADTESVTVVLHKVLLDENDTTTTYDNQGAEIPSIDEARLLNGAGFTVYNVTSLIAKGETATSLYALNEANGASYFDQLGLKVGSEVITGAAGSKGLATFELATKDADANASYLIIETTHPEIAKLKISQPILLQFPVTMSDAALHLYPKNYQYVRDPFFYKHATDSKGKDLGGLAGATFRLYKEDAAGNRSYLHTDIVDNNNKWVMISDPNVTVFTSDKSGLVTTGEHWLPIGTYYFEEISAPDGYEKTLAAQRVKVTVPEDSTQPVTITVADKTTSMADARVYNLKTDDPAKPSSSQPKPSGSQPSGSQPSGSQPSDPNLPTTGTNLPNLPFTGEQLMGGTLLGAGLILLVIFIQRKRQAQSTENNEGGDEHETPTS